MHMFTIGLCTLGLGLILSLPASAAPDRSLPKNAAPSPVQASGPFSVSMQVNVESGSGLMQRSILPDERVRIGERFSATLQVDEPVFLYVIHFDPKGWSELLFPSRRHVRVAPTEEIRIPGLRNAFVVTDEPGDIELHVIASRQPLEDKACSELRLPCPLFPSGDGTRGGNADDKEKKEPPPHPPPERARKRDAESGTRGQESDRQKRIVKALSDERGVAALWFSFGRERPGPAPLRQPAAGEQTPVNP